MNRISKGSLAALAGFTLFAGVGAASCDKANEPFKDAPRGQTNNDTADIVTMPDGFSNAATKCDHGNRIYSIFHGDHTYGSITVVPKDPTCPAGP